MKKKLTILTLIIMFFGALTFNFISVKADSGWDSDYDFDFGGSSSWDSDWDSDWGSSSSWDNDYSYSGGGYSGSSDFSIVGFIFFIIILIIIISVVNSSKKGNSYSPTSRIHTQGNTNMRILTQEELESISPGFNKKEFEDKAYQMFLDVQKAWMEFDYKRLRELLTDELYNTYHTQLVALKAKHQKNIMEDFRVVNMGITSLIKQGNKLTATLSLVVGFYDYVVDKNGNVVRGKKDVLMTNSYDLTFTSSITKGKKKCPSCGAPLANESSNKCEYCGSTVVLKDHDWIMSKKEIRR